MQDQADAVELARLLDAVDDLVSQLQVGVLFHRTRRGQAIRVQNGDRFRPQILHHFGKRGVFWSFNSPGRRPYRIGRELVSPMQELLAAPDLEMFHFCK